MKVLHAAETIKGGVATVINSLVEDQVKNPKISKVSCLVPSDQYDNLIQLDNLDSYCFERNGRNIMCMFNFFLSLYKLIWKEKPDVIHLHSSFAGLLGRIAVILSGRRKKIKVIYCPHAFSFLMQTNARKHKIYVLAERFLSIFTDKIICVSQSEYNDAIQKGFNPKKLVLIHNGVKIKNKINIRPLNNKKNYKILFVGRFDFQKGIDTLSNAISFLAEYNSNIHYEFTLVGEAVSNDSSIVFKESNQVKINQLGWLKPNQLEELYLNHDALVIPSRWEGFAMVPLEAMSYGLPLLASNICAFHELESKNFKHITFFKDKDELFNIFKDINTLPLEKNREIAHNLFINLFTEENMKKNTLNCYIN